MSEIDVFDDKKYCFLVSGLEESLSNFHLLLIILTSSATIIYVLYKQDEGSSIIIINNQ